MDDPRWHATPTTKPARKPKLADLAPGEDDPVADHACPHCEAHLARRHWLAMHLARDHLDELTVDDAAMVGKAEAREDAYFARVRKHVRASLVIAPWVLFYFYGLILIGNSGSNPALGFIPLPGFVGFLALIYYMMFTRDEAPVRGQRPSGE